jgi:type III restriction enzyme
LKDGLVHSGFERQEANELIHAAEPQNDDLFTNAEFSARTVTFELPELPAPAAIPAAIADKIEIVPESGSVTFKGKWTASQEKQIEQLFTTPEGKAAAKEALERLRKPPATPRQKAPAELGELFHVPVLAYRTGDLWEDFEETHLLDGDWRLTDFPCELTERDFKKDESAMQRGRLTVNQLGKINLEYFDKVEAQMALFDMASDWTQARLLWWLERNIYEESVTPEDKSAFLNKAVMLLMEKRGFTIDELIYRKFRLRAALAEKVKQVRHSALRRNYQRLLAEPQRFSATEQCEIIFEQGRYAYNWPYAGFTQLPKHFFPVIGDLKEDGEEFRCAVFLATQLNDIKYWLRNISGKASSFSLQTSSDRFYPDFVCRLEDGRILVVEYKNTRDWELKENEEKRLLGELWAKRSEGKCIFIMPRGEDFASISKLVN